jgi:hypothetical protein
LKSSPTLAIRDLSVFGPFDRRIGQANRCRKESPAVAMIFHVMKRVRGDPFPFEVARDLLGILRALYASRKADGASTDRLRAIADLARELREAIGLARSHGPGTPGHAAAWERAERSVGRLSDLADLTTPLEPTLRAAGERIRSASEHADPRAAARRARQSR